jgi:hypothetical protein
MELYFALINLHDDAAKVTFAVSLLTERAAIWYRLLQKDAQGSHVFATWHEFTTALRANFTEANFLRKARDRLAQVRQTSSVQKYLQEFATLCLDIPDLSNGERLHRFMYGLKPQIRQQVELHGCSTYEEAATAADTVDQTIFGSTHLLLPLVVTLAAVTSAATPQAVVVPCLWSLIPCSSMPWNAVCMVITLHMGAPGSAEKRGRDCVITTHASSAVNQVTLCVTALSATAETRHSTQKDPARGALLPGHAEGRSPP